MDEVGRVKSDSTLCPQVAVQPADFRDSVHRDFSFWVDWYVAVTIIQRLGLQLKNTWHEGSPPGSVCGVEGVVC